MSTTVVRPESVLSLARDRWSAHPHWPHQTLLLGSHDMFRKTSLSLVARAESGADAEPVHWVFRAWKGVMHSHERYEEYKLYPYLTRRWGLAMSAAEDGHAALGAAEAEVFALRASGPSTLALADALRHHDDVLVDHLALEEELVIPALLALEPAEFETLLRTDIHTLLRRMESPQVG